MIGVLGHNSALQGYTGPGTPDTNAETLHDMVSLVVTVFQMN